MTPTFEYDATAYRKAARDLVQRFHIDGGALLRDEARLLVEDLIQLTPPKNNGGLSAGQRAVQRDIGRVFLPIRKALKLMRESMGNDKVTKLINRLLRKGKFEAAKYWLMPQKMPDLRVPVREHTRRGFRISAYTQTRKIQHFPIPGVTSATDVSRTFDPSQHRRRLNAYGQITGKGYSQLLIGDEAGGALRRYIEEVRERVGFSIAGWLPAADAVRFRVAAKWINRFRGKAKGNVVDASRMSGPKMSITLINRSSKMPDLQHMVNGAVKLRMKNFEADAARILNGGLTRRAPFKGSAAYGKPATE